MNNQELVELKKGQILTTSLKFAEEFGIEHKEVLRKIKNLVVEHSTDLGQFTLSEYNDVRGRKYPLYYMNRDGYLFLLMNTSAKGKSLELIRTKQQLFIKAFNKMEEMLLMVEVNKQNKLWSETRQQGIEVRNNLTDVIQKFVDYATEQGSVNANYYFSNVTKMEYKALGILQENVPSLRSTFDNMQLYELIIAEAIATDSFTRYMEQRVNYKEIYILVKRDILKFASGLIPRVSRKEIV